MTVKRISNFCRTALHRIASVTRVDSLPPTATGSALRIMDGALAITLVERWNSVATDKESFMSQAWQPKVWNPADDSPPSVDDAFVELFHPWLLKENRARDTVQSYERYVKAWEEYWKLIALQDGSTCPGVLKEIACRG